MQTVPEISTTRKTVAFYASLDNQVGMAMCTPDDVVSFQVESTGTWTTLTNADSSRLQLNGRVDIADAQLLADGNKVLRCSRTLVGV
jgi:hypothetical protein